MKLVKLKQLAALAGLAMVAAPMMAQLASAAPAGFMTHKDSKGAVYFGGTPNAELSVTVAGQSKTKYVRANACGLIVIKNSTTSPLPASFTVGSDSITVASLPTQLLPKCDVSTGQLEEARTVNFKTAYGDVVVVDQPNASLAMVYPSTSIKKVRMNACGFGKVSNSTTNPFGASVTFTPFGGSALTYSAIDTKPAWICSKDGTTYAPMTP